MASEYTPFCPRYCHRSVLGIRSANKYYIQACVLGKNGGDGDEDDNCLGFRVISTPSATLVHPVSGGQFSKQKRSASLNYKQD